MLASVIVGIGLLMIVSKWTYLHSNVPLDKSPEIWKHGRELVEKFGYPRVDTFSAFNVDQTYLEYLKEQDHTPQRWQSLAAGQPSVIQFWYRSSPDSLAPRGSTYITFTDPQNTVPGMSELVLDTKGRLVYFEGIPPRFDEPGAAVAEFDWTGLFTEAGFDLAVFQSGEPQWVPRSAFDDRRAFSGTYPDNSGIAIRVEAATYRGKLVSFKIIEPWTTVGQPGQPTGDKVSSSLMVALQITIFFGVLFLHAWMAVKNVRAGRSDIRGVPLVMAFMFVVRIIIWVSTTHHIPSASEINLLINGLQSALYWAGLAGLIYSALEPYLQKTPGTNDLVDQIIGRRLEKPARWTGYPHRGAVGVATNCLMVLFFYIVPTWQGTPLPQLLSRRMPRETVFLLV